MSRAPNKSSAVFRTLLDSWELKPGVLVFLRHDQEERGPRIGIVLSSYTIVGDPDEIVTVLWPDAVITEHLRVTLKRISL